MTLSLAELLANTTVQITGGVLIGLLLSFLLLFFLPALRLRWRLGRTLKALQRIEKHDEPALRNIFAQDKTLLHLWNEFSHTLHTPSIFENGALVQGTPRATAPAEAFFSAQYVVDSQVRSEFFKHLPGIFTGVGIIGTFIGLIAGLQQFVISDDSNQVRDSLGNLLHGVYEAFFVSASAITLAMVVTFLEKVLLASLYRTTEGISHRLDSLYEMGAGEAYLQRLVEASEESATQSKHLKESLVGDLKDLLEQITTRQIESQERMSQQLGERIVSSITESMKQPLDSLTDAVRKASGDQSETAAALLKDVMASFSQRLNDLFGGQVSGLQELNQKSAQAMQDAVAALHTLIGKMRDDSQQAGTAMAEKMAQAVAAMEQRQAEMNSQSREVIDAIRTALATSQEDMQAKTQEALQMLGTQMQGMLKAMQEAGEQSQQAQQQREQALLSHSTQLVSGLSGSVEQVLQELQSSTQSMRGNIDALQQVTTASIDRFNVGAQRIEQGAQSFVEAGDRVNGALERSGALVNQMVEVGGALTTASTALQSALGDYKANREATVATLTELRAVIEVAKREAGLTQQALAKIETAATKLAANQSQAEAYLDKVSEILGESHGQFAEGLLQTLRAANTEFHDKLGSAVGMLGSAIENFELSLSDRPRRS